ncbi:MAG TPA: hypothetical protein VK999_03900 [Methylotenera sp.]|nr:hypothetical protein [Methylotenera sp.]
MDQQLGTIVFNLGYGEGLSVTQEIEAVEQVTEKLVIIKWLAPVPAIRPH